MLEQQSRLLITECHMLQKELSRYRKNLAKVIDMHNAVTIERDTLRFSLAESAAYVKKLQSETYDLDRKIRAMKGIVGQRDAVMRQFNIPEHFFGTVRDDL